MSLSTPQRTDIKRIIEALGRQAVELQHQRGNLIRLMQSDPSIVEGLIHTPHGLGYVVHSDPTGSQYAESVKHLILKVQRIQSSLDRIKEKIAELHMLIPPIESLPAEVLVMIFQVGSLSEQKGVLPFPMLICSVSRRWRDIAMSAPSMWTNLRIAPGTPRSWPALALHLSANYLLDIMLDFRTTPLDVAAVECLLLLRPHIERWRSFSLITDNEELALDVGNVLADAHAPYLRHLRLSLNGSGTVGNHKVYIPRLFNGGAPVLSSVRFDSVELPWRQSPVTKLTDIDMRWLWYGLSYTTFQDILAASPNLTRLTLRGKHVYLWSRSDYIPLYLPNLRHLELSGDNFCRMCALLVTPGLESLTLANVDEGEFREFMAWLPFSGTRYSSLQTLVLLNVATCTLSWNFLAAFSTITQLVIMNSGADRFLEVLRPQRLENSLDHPTLVWPRLRDVTMLDQTQYDELYGMVAERAAHGAPLQRLIVHTEFIHRYMHTPLTQYVNIDSFTRLDREL